jgi:hypothetical protein
MKALFVTRYFPRPANAGDLLYSDQMIMLFSKLAEEVDVFCAPHPDSAGGGEAAFPSNVTFHMDAAARRNLVRYALTTTPKAANDFATLHNRRALLALLRRTEPDMIVVDHIGSSWCVDVLRRYMRETAKTPRIVYITHNEETSTRLSIARRSVFPWNVAHLLDARRIQLRDRRILAMCDLLTCIAEADRDLHLMRFGRPSIVLPATYTGSVVPNRSIGAQVPRRVIVVSGFQWSAKLLNLDSFLSEGAEAFARAGVKLEIIGKMSSRDKRRFSRKFPTAAIRGTVDKIEPFVANARMGLLIDSAGGGFKLSLLTYIFGRLPIAALGDAVRGLGQRCHMIERETIRDLVAAVVERIDDFDFLNDMQEKQFDAMQSYLSDASNLSALGQGLLSLGRETGSAALEKGM